jgi:hypothetical protein
MCLSQPILLWSMLELMVIAGLASGTFYSLTMTFVLTALPKRLIILGIAAYGADVVFSSKPDIRPTTGWLNAFPAPTEPGIGGHMFHTHIGREWATLAHHA